jgi:hypothetical protein
MDEIKNIVDDIGIAAFENKINLAALAVISDSGNLIFQTDNWDISNQVDIILNVLKGVHPFVISNVEYSVVNASTEGIIGTNNAGMGHIIIVPFQGGVLVSYAMPQADPPKAFNFLKNHVIKLDGKI